jgi:Sap, sulfolipid-1-addressing protein
MAECCRRLDRGGRMGEAIGHSVPLAVGVALSPVPIIAVVVLLTSSRARALGPVFVLGWLLGLVVVGAIVLAVVGPSGAGSSAQRTRWVSWVMIVLGVLLLVEAVRRLRGRTGRGEEIPLPAWMAAIDRLKPSVVLGGGVVLGGVRPKSFLLAAGGAAAIAQTGIAGGQQAIAYAVFAVIATIGVAAPVVIYFAMGTRSGELLGRLKGWMRRNNAVILAVVLLVIGVTLIGDGIGGLAS